MCAYFLMHTYKSPGRGLEDLTICKTKKEISYVTGNSTESLSCFNVPVETSEYKFFSYCWL